jgi:hypothetical protein
VVQVLVHGGNARKHHRRCVSGRFKNLKARNGGGEQAAGL